jgi:hypothetical protein
VHGGVAGGLPEFDEALELLLPQRVGGDGDEVLGDGGDAALCGGGEGVLGSARRWETGTRVPRVARAALWAARVRTPEGS